MKILIGGKQYNIVGERVKLKVVYEDEDIVVMQAPDDKELEKLILETIKEKGRPLSWRELRQIFSGLAGEDRLRKALINLIEREEIIEMVDGSFGLPGMERNYVPRKLKKRIRPLVAKKFRERWGTYLARLRHSKRYLEKKGS